MLQLFKYGIVGVSINALLYALYLIITYGGISPKIAASGVYAVGIFFSYLGHKNIVFKDQSKRSIKKIITFVGAYLSGYAINMLGLYILVDQKGFAHELVQAAMIIIIAAYLFLLQKLWIFRTNDTNSI